MLTSEKILNEFYKGLKLLIEFETGQSRGVMSSPFFALNKVVAHFNNALDEGDVVAPFFFHYLADKFPAYVDKSQLPDLSSVPSHKSQAHSWIKDYQTFLTLCVTIDEITRPRLIECKSVKQVELSQSNTLKQLKRVEEEIAYLTKSGNSFSGVLAAKAFERLQAQTKKSQLNKLIVSAYEKSAFYPNVYAMYEYALFLQDKGMHASSPAHQQKLETELKLLAKSNGDINILAEHYQTEKNYRFLSQWLFQSAIHGGVDGAIFMIERYIFDEHIQWLDKISNKDKLVEAIKWFQWYEAHASLVDFQAYWREIARLASNYRTVINNDRYKAAFLCYALERINLDLRQLSQTMTPDLFASQYMDLAGGIECFRDIVELAWSLNNNQLPPQCSLIATNEMAIILEARHEYKQAEYLYRQAYTLDANHPIHQYNLANILLLQNKNKTERISLFLDAARQGCEDSIKHLFKVLVIERDGTIDQLEQLKDVFESFDFDFGLDVAAPSTLLINMIIMTIYQQLTNKEIIKWRPCERDGKKSVEAIFTFEEENLDIGASSSESPDSSSVGPFASSSIEATGRDEITDTKEKNTAESTSTNSFRLFQPVKKENKPFDARKERALCKLHDLNSKPVKSLCLKDLIQAKKAYQTLMGESGGVELSHKGKTSGSRAKVGDMNMHLTHGRDRMSIGAQSEIKDTIQGFCSRIGKM